MHAHFYVYTSSPRNSEDLSDAPPIEGPRKQVTSEMIGKANGRVRVGKAEGPSF